MGEALLQAIQESHALDPVSLPGDRTSLYIPFETLLSNPCESILARGVATGQRIAVVGTVGCGKSSLAEYVLADGTGLAPLWVTAAHENDETVTDPTAFARHMIRQIVRGRGKPERCLKSNSAVLSRKPRSSMSDARAASRGQ